MDENATAIEAIVAKDPSGFKEAVVRSLSRKLTDTLLRAREAVAASVMEANVLAPSAPASTGAPVRGKPPAGVDTAMEDELSDEMKGVFGMEPEKVSMRAVAKDDDISLDPNFEKEYLSKSVDMSGHKVQLKQIGLGLSKPIRVYIDGERWELFPGPDAAMKATKEHIKTLGTKEGK
jgi:hypothetical protein